MAHIEMWMAESVVMKKMDTKVEGGEQNLLGVRERKVLKCLLVFSLSN